jgi:acetoacetyl-CoA reductase
LIFDHHLHFIETNRRDNDMSKKVAYVTGGMGGIGTAICQRLHKEGFKVIAGCGPTRDFTKWLDEQKALGYTFYASVGNVGDWNSTVEPSSSASPSDASRST